jgi:hypothetical protein
VQAISEHDKWLVHFGGKNGKGWKKASGMDVDTAEIRGGSATIRSPSSQPTGAPSIAATTPPPHFQIPPRQLSTTLPDPEAEATL